MYLFTTITESLHISDLFGPRHIFDKSYRVRYDVYITATDARGCTDSMH